jgi:hypothetical protein
LFDFEGNGFVPALHHLGAVEDHLCSSAAFRLIQRTRHCKKVTDGWKLELLDTICLDLFFTCQQARHVVESMDFGNAKVGAASRMFTRIVDAEDWHSVEKVLTTAEQELLNEQLGVVQLFNAKNPTGRYCLHLSNQVHYFTATRLLELYRQQWANGLCEWPLQFCFTEYTHNGKALDVNQPHKMMMPSNSGTVTISFVDLRHVPAHAQPMAHPTLLALRSVLLNSLVSRLPCSCASCFAAEA